MIPKLRQHPILDTPNPLRNYNPANINSDMVDLFKEKFANSIASDQIIQELDVKLRSRNWDYKCFIEGIEFILQPGNAISNELFQINSDSISFKGYTYKSSSFIKDKLIEGFYTKVRSKLVFGKIQFSNGEINKGIFEYIPEKERMALIEGEICLIDGKIAKGTFKYTAELHKVVLVNGVIIWPDGYIEKGKRAFIPEVNEMRLVTGEIKYSDGSKSHGTWVFSVEENKMVLTSN